MELDNPTNKQVDYIYLLKFKNQLRLRQSAKGRILPWPIILLRPIVKIAASVIVWTERILSFKWEERNWIKFAVDFQFCTTSKHFDSSNFISPPCNRIVLCTIHTIQYTSLTMKRVGCYGAWSSQWKGHVPCLLCKMQGHRTVWKSGDASSNVMGISCPSRLRWG